MLIIDLQTKLDHMRRFAANTAPHVSAWALAQNSLRMDRAGFEPAASALRRRRSYQTDLPAQRNTIKKRIAPKYKRIMFPKIHECTYLKRILTNVSSSNSSWAWKALTWTDIILRRMSRALSSHGFSCNAPRGLAFRCQNNPDAFASRLESKKCRGKRDTLDLAWFPFLRPWFVTPIP